MENATKALLIAGSILIAILLIAMGVKIFSSTSGTTKSAQSTMDATAITTFNTQFIGYLNKQITATQCGALIQKIIASNATNESHHVGWLSQTGDPTSATATDGIYKAHYNSDGYIDYIYK